MDRDLAQININETESNVIGFSILDDHHSTWNWLIVTGLTVILLPLSIFLINVLVLRNYNVIAFSIGELDVAWYGIFIFIGFMAAIFISCIKMWKLYKISIDPFYWFCLMGIPTAILGARLWSCALGDASWSNFWAFRDGGLAIEGGVVLTVLLACWWFPFILKYPKYQVRDFSTKPNKVRQVSFLAYVDAIVPAILIGQIIGRYGNYQNEELYGRAIDGSYANFIEHLFPLMRIDGSVYQPLFFYESTLNWWGLILIFFVGEFIPKKKIGDLGFAYFIWYGILRLSLEPLRQSQFTFILTYVMSALYLVVGIVLIVLNHTVLYRFRKYSLVQTIKNKKMTLKNDDQILYYLGR
ncbi:MAG: prolipoprotein diacylglyceryl transferase [Mycoplasmataceae bacterium]|nr:prolipoprotein diacylglyceryl transferase [Mycoplasmataceae bacterium]